MAKVVKIKSSAVISNISVLKKIEAERALPAKYISMIKENPSNQKAYTKLMIIYRKLKQYTKELAIINKAIKTFEQISRPKKTSNKKIQSISRQLSRQLGLTDSKGKAVYSGEPVSGWRKRKETVMKRLNG